MTTRSSTAPAGTFLPVSIVVSLIVLIALLFAVLQTANLPIFPAGNSASYGKARAPLFRGLVHIPEFHFLPLFRGAPELGNDEDQMQPAQRIDRWEPFIKEASVRFSIPEKWIRTVIRIESGGRTMLWGRPITSGAGAMGVMQLMRDTYNEVSARNGLGSDPYNVHDNILAGTAYLRELYNRYGYPRLFEAYNAGPAVLDAHIKQGAKLPAETRNYVKMAVAGTATPAQIAAMSQAAARVKAVPVPKSKPAPVKLASAVVAKHVSHAAPAKPIRLAAAHTAAKRVRVAAIPARLTRSHAAKPIRVAAHIAPKAAHAAPARHGRHLKAA